MLLTLGLKGGSGEHCYVTENEQAGPCDDGPRARG